MKLCVRPAQARSTSALRRTLRSTAGAIDLASIMVGVIVIGVIAGAIAATVFAVIPWSQDNAAKEQMVSIHTAESAFYVFSADPDRTSEQADRYTFTSSANLETASLLPTSFAYCAIPTADGQNYNAYVKSASGKIWKATNSQREAMVKTGTGITCLGTVEEGVLIPESPTVDIGNGDARAPQPVEEDYGVPIGTAVYAEPFTTYGDYSSLSTIGFSSPSGGYYTQRNSAYDAIVVQGTSGSLNSKTVALHPGTYSATLNSSGNYRASWPNLTMTVNNPNGTSDAGVTWNGRDTSPATHTINFVVTSQGPVSLTWSGSGSGETKTYFHFYDLKIVKTAN
jgi:type II secretory pathway pseudopilin PulG